jgi:hypothetical protein
MIYRNAVYQNIITRIEPLGAAGLSGKRELGVAIMLSVREEF